MKILWYVNIVMPNPAQYFNFKSGIGGGWLIGQSQQLAAEEAIQLSIVTISPLVAELQFVCIEKISYIIIPAKSDCEAEFTKMLTNENYDVVHIFGTEYEYNTKLIELCASINQKFVVSIQGIVEECAKAYDAALPAKFHKAPIHIKIMKKLYFADSIALSKRDFIIQGAKERKALNASAHVIGRTAWDKQHLINIKCNAKYHCVNENLRDEFYCEDEWSYANSQKHSIFVSQASYPIKGLHQLLNVLPKLVNKYPDMHVFVGGNKFYSLNNRALDLGVDCFFEYQKYVKAIIKKEKLAKYITFTGLLNASQMKEMYLKTNVFLSASSAENSPNSVGEAMILACPIVASNVGGVSSILIGEQEGLLYDFYDTDELFNKLSAIFDNEKMAYDLGQAAKKHAISTHNTSRNTMALIDVYNEIAI